MTTVTIDAPTRTFRVPVLALGRFRGTIVLQVSERLELRVHRRGSRRTHVTAAAGERLEAARTSAMAHRMGAGF